MIIGYDLDGTLCDFNESVFWHVLQKVPLDKRKAAHENYFRSRKPLLNPELFCSKGDEYHVITARNEDFRPVTLEWCNKFVPNANSVNTSGVWATWGENGNPDEERPNHRQIKADMIRKLGYKPGEFLSEVLESQLRLERSKKSLEWFKKNRLKNSGMIGVDMIRKDRDSR